jgi:O-antigen/teichoic acid export membrane protein
VPAEGVGARDDAESGSASPRAADSAGPAWRRNRELLGNAGSLVATTGVSALLGFAFWAVAAHLFTQGAVGFAAAATSAMTLLGTVGVFGLGTFLMAELPRRPARANLIAAALLAAGLGSIVIGLVFVLVAPHVSASFRHSSGTAAGAVIFVLGVALTAATLVFDQATIGLLRGGLQLSRNAGFGAAKLLVLLVAGLVLRDRFGVGIELSWVAGLAISVVPIAVWLAWRGSDIFAQPDWHVLRGMSGTVAAHNWLNLAATAPTLVTPILVTVLVSPSANGAFYAAWMLVSVLYLVPTHLSTVLFAVAASDPQALARKLRFTLLVSLLVGLPGMAVLGLGAHLVLSIFGPGYVQEATLPLMLLVVAYIPVIFRTHYVAVCRAAGQMPRAAAVLTIAAALEVAAVVIGARSGGLVGLSVALVAVRLVTGAAVTPPVVRAALGKSRHPRGRLSSRATLGTGREERPRRSPMLAA